VNLKKEELLRIIQSCAGLWIEAIANDFSAAPGNDIQINATLVNRSDFPFKLREVSFPGVSSGSTHDLPLNNNDPVVVKDTLIDFLHHPFFSAWFFACYPA